MFNVDKNKCFLSTVYKKGGKEFFNVILSPERHAAFALFSQHKILKIWQL